MMSNDKETITLALEPLVKSIRRMRSERDELLAALADVRSERDKLLAALADVADIVDAGFGDSEDDSILKVIEATKTLRAERDDLRQQCRNKDAAIEPLLRSVRRLYSERNELLAVLRDSTNVLKGQEIGVKAPSSVLLRLLERARNAIAYCRGGQ